jgi:uncharacterized protein YjbI with pentapeptide repeats
LRRKIKLILRAGSDLRGIDLRGADFSGQDIKGRDFSEQDLSGARFDGAGLTNVDLRGAVLTAAGFTRAVLDDVDLSLAKAEGADFRGASFRRCRAVETQFSGARFDSARLSACDLDRANMSRVSAVSLTMDEVSLAGAGLTGAILRGAHLNEVDFSEAGLEGSDLSLSILKATDFRDARLDRARFLGTAGLAEEQKRYFRARGASVGWSLGRMALLISTAVLAGAVVFSCRFFSMPRRLPAQVLHERIQLARKNLEFERVLEYNRILLDRLSDRRRITGEAHPVALVNRTLSAARAAGKLGRLSEGMALIAPLIEKNSLPPEKRAEVLTLQALLLLKAGNPGEALAVLERLPAEGLGDSSLFNMGMTRLMILRRLKRFEDGLAVCEELTARFRGRWEYMGKIRVQAEHFRNMAKRRD